MCGVTGWVAYGRDLSLEAATLATMLETLAPRGPDGSGTWHSPHVALGQRRLAVIDLAGGGQPMTADVEHGGTTAPVCLVYSGEVYNFVELREELRRRGHRFRTNSDTEVVLRAYIEWEHEMVDRLNGMFAFAIWDSRMDRLLMARDRLGVKPLFFAPMKDGVLFGSEPKAILAHPAVCPVVDADGFRELCSVFRTRKRSIWAGIEEVEPGSVVTVDRAGIHRRLYWRLSSQPHSDSRDTTVQRIRQLLEEIVRHQLAADVPRCLLLSGGLDSSALTALAARHLARTGETIRSFAVDFVGQAGNFMPSEHCKTRDTPYAHEVADYVHSQHFDVVLDHASMADPKLRCRLVRAADAPIIDDGFNSLYLLFKSIREHSVVALSGESADEVFGGYPWFHARQAQNMEPWIVYLMAIRNGWITESTMLSRDLLDRLELRSYMADAFSSSVGEVDRVDGESAFEWRMRRMLYLHLTRMLQIVLDRADRMSMAAGLELRIPYCDHRLVEYVFNAPWAFKIFDGREKSLLRHAVHDVLPESILQREKSGYPLSHDPAYTRSIVAQIRDLFAAGHAVLDLVDPVKLKRIACEETRMPHPQDRWGLEQVLSMASWLDLYRPELRLP